MADDLNNTKAAFDKNWVSATEVGNHVTQSNDGAWILAVVDIRDALLGGCRAALELDQGGQKSYRFPAPKFWFPGDRLRWVNGLNPSMRREDFPGRLWPWELRAYVLPSELRELFHGEALPLAREQVSMLRVFLHRADAVQWGLLPPQAVVSEESPSPDKQPTAATHAQSAPEQPEAPPRDPAQAAPERVAAATADPAQATPEPATSAASPAATTPAAAADQQLHAADGSEPSQSRQPQQPPPVARPDEPVIADPAPSPTPEKRSRKKTIHGGAQSRRAIAVLNRIFPEKSEKSKYRDRYPDEDEMAWQDVWDEFDKEYPHYAEDHPSRYGRPSPSTVRRVMGRAE
jgi:hypothetical protein